MEQKPKGKVHLDAKTDEIWDLMRFALRKK